MTTQMQDADTGEDVPEEELKPKRRRVTPAEVEAKRQDPGFVSPIRQDDHPYPGPMAEPDNIAIDDPEHLATLEAAERIFHEDMIELAQVQQEIKKVAGRGVVERSLVQKLVAVMAAIDGVEKKGRNESQKYNYQRAVDVTIEVRPLFIEQGLMLITSIDEVRHEVQGQTRSGQDMWLTTVQGSFTVSDGVDSISFNGSGAGTDTGDKGVYKAITGMVKYGLRTLLLIPDEKMDPEVEREDERPQPPVIVQASNVPQPQQGGRQAFTTEAQLDAIASFLSDLAMDSVTFRAMVVSLLPGVPDYETGTEGQRFEEIMGWLADQKFADTGKVVKALHDAKQSNGGA